MAFLIKSQEEENVTVKAFLLRTEKTPVTAVRIRIMRHYRTDAGIDPAKVFQTHYKYVNVRISNQESV